MYRLSCLIEVYDSTERYWLMCVGLLAVHLFNEGAIFHQGSLLAAVEWAAGFCGGIPPTCKSHSAVMDRGRRPDMSEVSPGLLPVNRSILKSPANSSPVNMAANPPKSRILLTTAGWSKWCGPALNLVKRHIFCQDTSLWTQGTTWCLKSSR